MVANFYSKPSSMTGGLLPIYAGKRRLKGGKLFGSLRNFMAPIGKQILHGLKTVAKNKSVQNIAKEVAKRGTEVLANVAVDALQGRHVGESFKERAKEAALNAITGNNNSRSTVNHQSQSLQTTPARKFKQRQRQRQKSIKPSGQARKKRPAKSLTRNYQPLRKRRRSGKLSRALRNQEDLF